MAFEKTWRWFGDQDPISLSDLKQMGVEGVVTSLYHIATGEEWPVKEICSLKRKIERYGLRWSVVESLPVADGIKRGSPERPQLIRNYLASLRNLGTCGIDTVCYNFMPVLDWARTDIHYKLSSGVESMLFDYPTFAAFDIFILKREHASDDYPDSVQKEASKLIQVMNTEQQEELAHNIIVVTQSFIHGIVGDCRDYKQQFRNYLKTYEGIGKKQLQHNLSLFLKEVVPVAEKVGVRLCIHPDDPPFPLLGLPRIASTADDLQWIVDQCDSLSNGITFCVGSLSARQDNDLVKMAKQFASRIQYIHLRNTTFLSDNKGFYESGHLSGNVDMFSVVKLLLEEQQKRLHEGRKDSRMPFRPDHGLKMLDDYERKANPGYPLIGRLKGLAEIDGLQMAIEHILIHQ
ncbi:MAG: mannonate dehydratase [Parabacteroides sp.]|jgi:mannonate dehydratase|nr:mannonate dehydratase [Parabacteroides sp.]